MEFGYEDLKKILSTESAIIGSEILIYDEVDSTNNVAFELLRKGYPSGTVVIADRQTSGRGRLGRKWVSVGGKNIYMSFTLRPNFTPRYATLLTLTSAVACTTAIRRITEVPVVIKWPNDMLIGQKKVGGILNEMRIEGEQIKALVVGVGINVNMDEKDIPNEIADVATSLRIYKGKEFSRPVLIAEIIKEFERWYRLLLDGQAKTIIRRWLDLSDTIGRAVKIVLANREIVAVAEAIDDEGRLVVRLHDGTYEKISAGDVILLRTY